MGEGFWRRVGSMEEGRVDGGGSVFGLFVSYCMYVDDDYDVVDI